MHHDFRLSSIEELQRQWQRAEELGAAVLNYRTDDDGGPLYVLADPRRTSLLHSRRFGVANPDIRICRAAHAGAGLVSERWQSGDERCLGRGERCPTGAWAALVQLVRGRL